MPTTTNFGWTTPADTDLVKDGASAIRTLGNGIDTSLVDLKGGTTGQLLSKASNTDLDFSWTTVTTGGLTLIQETVAAANSAIDFTSIPGTYKQLLLYWDGIYHSGSGSNFDIRFNSDSGTNYKTQVMRWEGSAIASSGGDYTSLVSGLSSGAYAAFGYQITSSTNYPAAGFLIIDNYASSTKFKHYNAGWNFSETGTSVRFIPFLNGHYASQTPITSINVVRLSGSATMTNVTNTTVRLYGVA